MVSTTSLPGTERPDGGVEGVAPRREDALSAGEHVVLGGLDACAAVARAEVADGVRGELALGVDALVGAVADGLRLGEHDPVAGQDRSAVAAGLGGEVAGVGGAVARASARR